jgi:predicted dehydrogenase
MAINGGRLRAGVVGTGHMGQYHVLVYAELPDVDLVGVADLDAARATAVARQYETQAFVDHR